MMAEDRASALRTWDRLPQLFVAGERLGLLASMRADGRHPPKWPYHRVTVTAIPHAETALFFVPVEPIR